MSFETGQPDPACASCRGLGWFHKNRETDEKYQRAQVIGRNSKTEDGRGGKRIQGGCSITFLPGVIPADGDLIQVCADIEVVNNEFHIKGSKLNDGETAEVLRFRDVKCVDDVLIQLSDTQVRVLDKSEWLFDPNARRVILNGLPPGTRYSVRYFAKPEYVVVGETAKPLLRVSKDEDLPIGVQEIADVVYPFNVYAQRLDRAILQRQRGSLDQLTPSTFSNKNGRGPFK